MKVLILAGGFGSRLSEETKKIPKPIIKIGEFPIIWHIMKYFSSFGYNDFVLLTGYKSESIIDYFKNTNLQNSKMQEGNNISILNYKTVQKDIWKITFLNTGLNTMTGGRILRAKSLLENKDFFLTYGDGLSNINLNKLINYHYEKNKLATISIVSPPERFGIVNVDDEGIVTSFNEKAKKSNTWINGGYFVCDNQIFSYIKNDETIFELEPMLKLVKQKKLAAFKHKGFWQCMDTLREKEMLTHKWETNSAEWKTWT